MKLHYMGKYNLDPESLPRGEHKAGAVKFKEAKDTKQMALIGNIGSLVVTVVLIVAAAWRGFEHFSIWQWWLGCVTPMLTLFPHELLHSICFKEDVYLYTNLKQGMLFVTGPEAMTKGRFIFLSLLPNIVFGIIPFVLGMLLPEVPFLAVFGAICTGMGFGDYYNVYNAATQMPKGARTYLHGFNSYWYIP